jgi:hypothetical protein
MPEYESVFVSGRITFCIVDFFDEKQGLEANAHSPHG